MTSKQEVPESKKTKTDVTSKQEVPESKKTKTDVTPPSKSIQPVSKDIIDDNKLIKETSGEVGEKVGKKVGKKAVEKSAKFGIKSLVKKVPVIGLLASGAFALDRILSGDKEGAMMELASGASSMIPGGALLSAGIDAALLAHDIKKENSSEDTGTIHSVNNEVIENIVNDEDIYDTISHFEDVSSKSNTENIKQNGSITNFIKNTNERNFTHDAIISNPLSKNNDAYTKTLTNSNYKPINSEQKSNQTIVNNYYNNDNRVSNNVVNSGGARQSSPQYLTNPSIFVMGEVQPISR